jgi:hypothetical protein
MLITYLINIYCIPRKYIIIIICTVNINKSAIVGMVLHNNKISLFLSLYHVSGIQVESRWSPVKGDISRAKCQ